MEMNVIDALEWRGLIQDVSDRAGLAKLEPGASFYVGFDPTAPSLQVGNLVPLTAALHLARAGFKPIILFGGATGAIGDPAGKKNERQLLDRSDIDSNVAKQSTQVKQLFSRVNTEVTFVNNYDWTHGLSVLDFLRDVGKHFTVNYMLAKEVIKTRLDGEGISFTEFSYMLLQAYDFWHLYQTKNCRLQVGGSDQWGNITAGLELIRRKLQSGSDKAAFAMSFPLVTDSQGRKFGKSEAGTIWLDPERTSPYAFHQFWLNLDDKDVIGYLKMFTFMEKSDIEKLESAHRAEPENRPAHKALANAMCTLIHGEAATLDVQKSAQVLFGGSLQGLSSKQLEEIFKDVPSSTMQRGRLLELSFLDLLVETKLATSKGEAKRLIANGGAYLNNERLTDGMAKVLNPAPVLIFRAGKKNYHLLKLTE